MNSIIQKIKDGVSNIISNLRTTVSSSGSGAATTNNTIWGAIFIAVCILLLFILLYLCCWVFMFVADSTSTQRIQLVSELRQFMVLLVSTSAFTVFSGFLKLFVDKDNDGIPDVLEQTSTSSSNKRPSSSSSSSNTSSDSSSTKIPLTTGTYNT